MNLLDVVLTKISQTGFHFQKEKSEFQIEPVRQLEHIFDKNGRHPDPDSINAIKSMSRLTDITTLS